MTRLLTSNLRNEWRSLRAISILEEAELPLTEGQLFVGQADQGERMDTLTQMIRRAVNEREG